VSSRFPWKAPTWPQSLERPAKPAKLGADYDTSWARSYPARLARVLLVEGITRPAISVLASPTVVGADALEELSGPVIFAANHQSHVDTPLVLSCLPSRFRHHSVIAAGADYFFDRPWKATISAGVLGAIPVDRFRVNRRSSDLARQLIGDGWNVVIFPEGGRSPDGWGREFRGGAAYLADRTGAPVVPIHLAGTRKIQARGTNKVRRFPTTVTFGAPLRLTEGEDIRRFNARIEAAVAALADEQSSDWYSARLNAATGATPSLQGPELAGWRRSWSLPDASRDSKKRDWPRN
jgi:1-acyl-sn-glycerol-3-phosphate acyltransferase